MSNSNDTDHRLWVRQAVEHHEGPLLRYAARLVGDVDRARDIVQDTFLRLCREDQNEIGDHLGQWLFTVCRRRALDVCRKESRMKTISDQQAAKAESRERDQAAATETQDTAAQIEKILGGLSDDQQEVIRLKFQNGMSYREISGVTQLSTTNVGYLIHTAIAKIRQELRINPKAAI